MLKLTSELREENKQKALKVINENISKLDLFDTISLVYELIELDIKNLGFVKCPICDEKLNYKESNDKERCRNYVTAKCETENCISFIS